MTSNLVEKLSLLLYLIYGTNSRNASDWSILSVSSYPAAIYMGILYIVAIRALHSYPEPQYRIYTTAIERNVRVYHSFLQLGSYVSEEFVVLRGKNSKLSVVDQGPFPESGWLGFLRRLESRY